MTSEHHAGLGWSPWDDNDIQFSRLLAEIYGIGLSLNQWRNLARSMDLGPAEIEEIFERAESAFELQKKNLLTGGSRRKSKA